VYVRTFSRTHRPKLIRFKIASVEYSCPRSRVHAGTRRPEEAGACWVCRSPPTSPVDMLLSTSFRKNSKSWQRPRAQLSLLRSAPPCPQHQQLRRRRRRRSHHARVLPCQFPVASNANSRTALSYSPTRRARARDPLVAVMAYLRRWAKYNDQAPQKRASLAYGLDHSKSSA